MENWIQLIAASFSSAFFAIGGGVILLYFKKGQVTADHLKKGDLDALENQIKQFKEGFDRHLERHEKIEKDFVSKEACEKQIVSCPVKQIGEDIQRNREELKQHEIKHGFLETKMDQRLIRIEEFAKSVTKSLATYSAQLSDINTNLQVMIQKFIDHEKANGEKWSGFERRDDMRK